MPGQNGCGALQCSPFLWCRVFGIIDALSCCNGVLMLLDIFARRYDATQLRDAFEERDRRLLVQAFRILKEDIFPYYLSDGKENSVSVAIWTEFESGLSREFGQKELSSHWLSYKTTWNGNDHLHTSKHAIVTVCENWMTIAPTQNTDTHIKDRLSLIELGFRRRETDIASLNARPISDTEGALAAFVRPRGAQRVGNTEAARQQRAAATRAFQASVDELNARFRQAGYPLNYHNGFIQISSDDLVQTEVETPFWRLVAHPTWQNVDLDMKEALDLRDSDGRDPAFYAARALESAIKIISEHKGWTHGKEKGAHNYIDNLASKANGFITQWEGESLKAFFTNVRNPFGLGPGSDKMPSLSRPQTEWAIEFSMSWIKNLIRCM